jgi:hypothetical protein
MEQLFPGTGNGALLKEDLDRLSNQEFDARMKDWAVGKGSPVAVLPNLTENVVTVDHLKAVADKWNVNMYQRILMSDPDTGREFLSPLRYMVLKIGVVRLSQMQETKQSIPEDNMSVDELTGQVTGDSKGSRLSFPELGNLASGEHDNGIVELISVRGGDEAANRQLEYDIETTGVGSLARAQAAGSGTTVNRNFATFLRVAHLDTTLDKGR